MIDVKGLDPIIQELRQLISSVTGAKSISETLSLSYVVEVEDEKSREAVEKVGAALSAQAERYGFVLEITPATTAELEEASQLYAEHLASQTKFKA